MTKYIALKPVPRTRNPSCRAKIPFRYVAGLLLAAILVLVPVLSIKAHAQSSPTFTDFPLPDAGGDAYGITTGPDGNLWFTDYPRYDNHITYPAYPVQIGRITPGGSITEYPLPKNNRIPDDIGSIISGPDDSLWFTYEDYSQNDSADLQAYIGRVTTSGLITLYPLPTNIYVGISIAYGADGNLWFPVSDNSSTYASNENDIGRMSASGAYKEFSLSKVPGGPDSVTTGPDGNIWYTERGGVNGTSVVGRITPSGTVTAYKLPNNLNGGPRQIISGPDGNLWYVEPGGNVGIVGRITTDGAITEYPVTATATTPATTEYGPDSIAKGADGKLWFETFRYSNNSYIPYIKNITPNGSITEYQMPNTFVVNGWVGGTIGSDGNLWLSGREQYNNALGRIIRVNTSSSSPITGSVPLLKQTSKPWGPDLYDSANVWAPNNKPTNIATWGCALTSATMVFQYYGYHKLPDGTALNPGTLNTWLENNNGYDSSGNVLWSALSSLSKKAKTMNGITAFDALEFKYNSGANKTQLTADLQNGQPDILEEPGHFIVATGISGSTYTINDPARSITALDNSKYNNTFLSLKRFVPSHSDLSYFTIIADPSANIKVIDSQGNAIGTSFVQQPLADPDDPSIHSSPLQYIYVQQPSNGNYRIEVSSSATPSDLAVYVYDMNGNVSVDKEQVSGNTTFDLAYMRDDLQKTVFKQIGVTINNRSQYTRTRDVTLQLVAPFAASLMRISNQPFTNDQQHHPRWQAFSSSEQWKLRGGDGKKTVYAQFKANDDTVSDVYTASIILDKQTSGISWYHREAQAAREIDQKVTNLIKQAL